MKKSSLFLIGGGLLLGGVGWYIAKRKSDETADDVKRILEGGAEEETAPGEPRGQVKLRLTGYWPYSARPDERKMEGGTKDRKGNPLITLEQHKSDPVRYPFVSCAGDYEIWPYGQRLVIPELGSNLVFRVVDTGGHFHGAGKLYRIAGYEPIDVCVDSSQTKLPKTATATIVVGDSFEKGRAIATGGLKGQTVMVGFVEGRSNRDHEALARAVESELSHRPIREQIAGAWALRNQADAQGVAIHQLLAPQGDYGLPHLTGGAASTRKRAGAASKEVAGAVLDAATEEDPTDGAVDFWMPAQQTRLNRLGDVYRAARAAGDTARARKYERYANYCTEAEARARLAEQGLSATQLVGEVELLGRRK